VLPSHLQRQLTFIRITFCRDDADPVTATPQTLDDVIQGCTQLLIPRCDFGGLYDVSGHYRRLMETLLARAHVDLGVRRCVALFSHLVS